MTRCSRSIEASNRQLQRKWYDEVFSVVKSDRERSFAKVIAFDFFNKKTGQLNPSDETIANRLRRSTSTVVRARKELIRLGFLRVRGGNGRGKTNHYELIFPRNCEKGHQASTQKTLQNPIKPASKSEQFCHRSQYSREPRYEPMQPPSHLPSMPLKEDNPDLVLEWNAYLTNQGFPPLEELNIRTLSGEFELPMRYPPRSNDEHARLIVERFLELKGVRRSQN